MYRTSDSVHVLEAHMESSDECDCIFIEIIMLEGNLSHSYETP